MSDQKLIEALSHRPPADDREAFLTLLKQKHAGAIDGVARATVEFVKQHPAEIAGAIIGAATLVGSQYAMNVKGKSGVSAQQYLSREALDAMDKSIAHDKADGKDPGFSKSMTRSGLVGAKDMSDVMAKYPVRGALTVAGPAASLGWALGGLGKSQIF